VLRHRRAVGQAAEGALVGLQDRGEGGSGTVK
jgi:hypothetical protein